MEFESWIKIERTHSPPRVKRTHPQRESHFKRNRRRIILIFSTIKMWNKDMQFWPMDCIKPYGYWRVPLRQPHTQTQKTYQCTCSEWASIWEVHSFVKSTDENVLRGKINCVFNFCLLNKLFRQFLVNTHTHRDDMT